MVKQSACWRTAGGRFVFSCLMCHRPFAGFLHFVRNENGFAVSVKANFAKQMLNERSECAGAARLGKLKRPSVIQIAVIATTHVSLLTDGWLS